MPRCRLNSGVRPGSRTVWSACPSALKAPTTSSTTCAAPCWRERPIAKEKNMESQIRILKFGSSVLRSEADLPAAVQEIYREWRRGAAVVAVVSAFGTTTDDLLKRAEQLGLPPSPGAVAALLATGEAAASALLTLALQRSGLPATLLDAHTARLATRGDLLDAELVSASSDRIRRALRDSIVVIPGFVGRDSS